MTASVPLAAALCGRCANGVHDRHRPQLGGICVGCACPVSVAATPQKVAEDDVRLQMAQVIMGALGFRRMLLQPEALEVEHLADGRVVVEWDAPQMVAGRFVVTNDEVAELRMRSTFTVAHEELPEVVDHA